METLVSRLRKACKGRPAKIAWPHHLLHEAADAIEKKNLSGEDISKAWRCWMETSEGEECSEGSTHGVYLTNRLERAFQAGARAASGIEEAGW